MPKFFEMSEKEIQQYLRRNQREVLKWYSETAGSRRSKQFFPDDARRLRNLLNLRQTTTRKGREIKKKSALLEIFPSIGERFIIHITGRGDKVRIGWDLENNIIDIKIYYDRT